MHALPRALPHSAPNCGSLERPLNRRWLCADSCRTDRRIECFPAERPPRSQASSGYRGACDFLTVTIPGLTTERHAQCPEPISPELPCLGHTSHASLASHTSWQARVHPRKDEARRHEAQDCTHDRRCACAAMPARECGVDDWIRWVQCEGPCRSQLAAPSERKRATNDHDQHTGFVKTKGPNRGLAPNRKVFASEKSELQGVRNDETYDQE